MYLVGEGDWLLGVEGEGDDDIVDRGDDGSKGVALLGSVSVSWDVVVTVLVVATVLPVSPPRVYSRASEISFAAMSFTSNVKSKATPVGFVFSSIDVVIALA